MSLARPSFCFRIVASSISAMVVLPPRPRADLRQHDAVALIVGGVEPEQRIVHSDSPLSGFLANPEPVNPTSLGGEGELCPGLSGHPIVGARVASGRAEHNDFVAVGFSGGSTRSQFSLARTREAVG